MAETTIYVVTSDEARNGKTFFARLLVEYLLLAKRNPVVFDAGWPHQHMKQRWPGRTQTADFSKVQGQMAFFDRVLAMPARDCVLDLSWRDLQTFLSLAEAIAIQPRNSVEGARPRTVLHAGGHARVAPNSRSHQGNETVQRHPLSSPGNVPHKPIRRSPGERNHNPKACAFCRGAGRTRGVFT